MVGGKWEKMMDVSRRVYSTETIAPTLHTCGGGNLEAKILEEPKVKIPSATKCGYEEATIGDSVNIAYPNSTTRRGRVGKGVAQTLLTGEEQAVLEPLVWDGYNQKIRKENDTTGIITCQCGHDLKRNGIGIIEPITTRGNDVASTIRASIHKQGERNLMENIANGRGYEGIVEPLEETFRVRKLTEKECFRLQGVKDEDFERVRQNQSKSSLYHLAGDSITTSVLMALFGEMLGIDWRSKVDDLAEDLSKERNIKNDTY